MTYLAELGGDGIAEPANLVRVQDDDHVIEFSGEKVAFATTHWAGKPRWLDIQLWRVTDGSGRYVIQRVGRSLVYHKYNGPCSRGVPFAVTELSHDAVPCSDCAAPPLNIARTIPGGLVMREADHPSAVVCASAADVLASLRLPEIGYSAPAQRLLDTARLNDTAINAAMSAVHRL